MFVSHFQLSVLTYKKQDPKGPGKTVPRIVHSDPAAKNGRIKPFSKIVRRDNMMKNG